MSNTSQASGGMGVGTVLTIVFVVLKLTGTIAWSWIWVLSPLWISFGIFLVAAIILLIGALIVAGVEARRPAGRTRR